MPQLSPTLGVLFFLFIILSLAALSLNLSSSPKKFTI